MSYMIIVFVSKILQSGVSFICSWVNTHQVQILANLKAISITWGTPTNHLVLKFSSQPFMLFDFFVIKIFIHMRRLWFKADTLLEKKQKSQLYGKIIGSMCRSDEIEWWRLGFCPHSTMILYYYCLLGEQVIDNYAEAWFYV